MKLSRLKEIINEEIQNILSEKTVRLSTMKDAIFEPGRFVQILGKKGKVKLDKKSVKFLAKYIRQNSGKHGMGWSFTEGKLTEKKPWQGYEKHAVHGKAEVDFLNLMSGNVDWKKYNKLTDKGKNVIFFTKKDKQPLVWQISNGRDVQATDLKGSKSSHKSYRVRDIYKVLVEGKLNEAKTLTLPNGVKAIIDFKGIKFKASKGAPVFLDRDELLKFFRGSTKYLRYT